MLVRSGAVRTRTGLKKKPQPKGKPVDELRIREIVREEIEAAEKLKAAKREADGAAFRLQTAESLERMRRDGQVMTAALTEVFAGKG
jgi:hypothetical protein